MLACPVCGARKDAEVEPVMSEEDNNIAENAEENGAAELNEALAESESGFVVEQKQSVSRGTLALFGVIIAAMGGLYFMHLRNGPSSAEAATAETQAANETISQFLTSGDQNIKKMQALIRDTEKIVAQFLQYPSMKQVPLSDLKTNPFRHLAITAAENGNGATDSKRRKEEERIAVLKAVQELQLQSIMHSEKARACMIGNTLYQEGQQVGTFTVEKINQKSVIVTSGAYRFELKMQH